MVVVSVVMVVVVVVVSVVMVMEVVVGKLGRMVVVVRLLVLKAADMCLAHSVPGAVLSPPRCSHLTYTSLVRIDTGS